MTWRAAMQQALYGGGGFYARGERPAAHFRTSVHASPRYAAALMIAVRATDAALGHPPRLDLVDVGPARVSCWASCSRWLIPLARRARLDQVRRTLRATLFCNG